MRSEKGKVEILAMGLLAALIVVLATPLFGAWSIEDSNLEVQSEQVVQ